MQFGQHLFLMLSNPFVWHQLPLLAGPVLARRYPRSVFIYPSNNGECEKVTEALEKIKEKAKKKKNSSLLT
jgi:hypothetical protein